MLHNSSLSHPRAKISSQAPSRITTSILKLNQSITSTDGLLDTLSQVCKVTLMLILSSIMLLVHLILQLVSETSHLFTQISNSGRLLLRSHVRLFKKSRQIAYYFLDISIGFYSALLKVSIIAVGTVWGLEVLSSVSSLNLSRSLQSTAPKQIEKRPKGFLFVLY